MFGRRGEQHNPAEPEELYRQIRDDFYFRTTGPLPGAGQTGEAANAGWLPLPERTVAFQLAEPLSACGTAQALRLQLKPSDDEADSQGSCPANGFIATIEVCTITDALGIVKSSLLADPHTLQIAAWTTGLAIELDGILQPYAFGEGCDCPGSGSHGSGSEGSGSAGSGSEGSGSAGSGSGGGGSGGGGSGGCCNGNCATSICCPTDCSAAPAIKAAATFAGTYTSLNFAATTLSRTGCAWSVTAGTGASVAIDCVNGGWVVTVQGGTSTQWKSDPMHVGSPYPPSGSYLCDIYVNGDPSGGPVTVTISK